MSFFSLFSCLAILVVVNASLRVSQIQDILDVQATWNGVSFLSRGTVNDSDWNQMMNINDQVIAESIVGLMSGDKRKILYLGVNTGAVQRKLLQQYKDMYQIRTVEIDQDLVSFYHTNKEDVHEKRHQLISGDPYKLVSTMATNRVHFDAIVEDLFDGDDTMNGANLHVELLFEELKKMSPDLIIRHVYIQDNQKIQELLQLYKEKLFGSAILLTNNNHSVILTRKSGIQCTQVTAMESFQSLRVQCVDA